jgi:hypothetical protein
MAARRGSKCEPSKNDVLVGSLVIMLVTSLVVHTFSHHVHFSPSYFIKYPLYQFHKLSGLLIKTEGEKGDLGHNRLFRLPTQK